MRRFLKSCFWLVCLSAPGVLFAQNQQPVDLIASGMADIFAAGLPEVPTLDGGGGILPPSYSFKAGPNQILKFSRVAGTVSGAPAFGFFGPNGMPNHPGFTGSYGGISGIIDSNFMFLAGVFLDDSPPAESPTPATLNFTGSEKATDVYPKLKQLFYIGDGQTMASGPQKFHVPDTATRLFLGFVDGPAGGSSPGDYSDNGGTLNATFTITSSCQVNPNDVNLFAGGPYSSTGKPTSMNATFTPLDDSGFPVGLAAKETACGYLRFNFQQRVTADPYPLLSALTGLPLVVPYADPPLGGYLGQPDTANRYPFYYTLADLCCGVIDLVPSSPRPITTDSSLSFADGPAEPRLAPLGLQDLEFETKLVGIPNDGSQPQVRAVFTWSDSFNGVAIGGLTTRSNWSHPLDPSSGIGGITITSINGVPQTPPSVSCAASPNILWPPNGQSVLVFVSGTVTAGTQSIPAGGTIYAVKDEYGQVQPSGGLALSSGGAYSFAVPLISARDGNDQDGRTYTINVTARDQIGNVDTCSAVVTVPHDQGN